MMIFHIVHQIYAQYMIVYAYIWIINHIVIYRVHMAIIYIYIDRYIYRSFMGYGKSRPGQQFPSLSLKDNFYASGKL